MSAPVTPYDRPRNRVSNTVFKSGPLFISSKGLGWKSWKKRWFILTRTSLVFFKNDPSALPQKGGEVNLTLGGIDLNNSGSVIVREDKKLLTVLFPDGRDGRAFTLKAESLEDLFEWKTALEHALAQAPNAALVMGQNGIFRNDSADAIEGSGEHWRDRRPVKSLVVGRPILLALEDIDGSPSFLEKALCFIEQYGVKVEGILRQSADVDEVDHRVHEYEQGSNQFSPDEDAHVVADCIKHVLRELPSSPVPAPCCTALLEAHRMEGKEARIAAMRLAVAETFPEPNRRLLQRVLKMMHAVASHTSENRMTASAVAACMAPLLLRPLLAGECEYEDESDRSGDNAAQLLAAAAAANNAQAIVTILLDEYDNIFVDDQAQQGPASPEMYPQMEDSGSEGSTDDEVLQIREDGFHDAQNDLEAELEDDPERVLSGTLSESSGNVGSDLYDYKVFEGGDSDVEYSGDMENSATKQKVSNDSYPQPEQCTGEQQGSIYVEGENDDNQGGSPNGSRLPSWGNGASPTSSPKNGLTGPGPGLGIGNVKIEMQDDMAHDHNETGERFRILENHIREVHRTVQILRDKQEIAETQTELAKLQLARKESPGNLHGSEDKPLLASSSLTEVKQENAFQLQNVQPQHRSSHPALPALPAPQQPSLSHSLSMPSREQCQPSLPQQQQPAQVSTMQQSPVSSFPQQVAQFPQPPNVMAMQPYYQQQLQQQGQIQQVPQGPQATQVPHTLQPPPPAQQTQNVPYTSQPPHIQNIPNQGSQPHLQRAHAQQLPQLQSQLQPQMQIQPLSQQPHLSQQGHMRPNIYSGQSQGASSEAFSYPSENANQQTQPPYQGVPSSISSEASIYNYGSPAHIVQPSSQGQLTMQSPRPQLNQGLSQTGDSGSASSALVPVPPGHPMHGYTAYNMPPRPSSSPYGVPFSVGPQANPFPGAYMRMSPQQAQQYAHPSGNVAPNISGGHLASSHGFDDLVEQVASMGFSRDQVRGAIQRLSESGQPVDMNSVLDRLNNAGGPSQRGWYN